LRADPWLFYLPITIRVYVTVIVIGKCIGGCCTARVLVEGYLAGQKLATQVVGICKVVCPCTCLIARVIAEHFLSGR